MPRGVFTIHGCGSPVILLLATLSFLSGCMVGGSRDDEVSSPAISITSDTEQDVEWPEHCTPEQITVLINAFGNAFNTGDTHALKDLLPNSNELVRRDDLLATAAIDRKVAANAAVEFQWFSMPVGKGEPEAIHTVEEVLAFVSNRHAAGDTLTIQSIHPAPDTYGLGLIDFGVMATLHAADGQVISLDGKAGIDCSHERIYLWSIGPG